ncbi:hypothetical protein FOE78_13090 [Microlunatus elymi]|uniref:Uncharacterized protein n=1 Tax=Microlunatus elymi TaxID=2596828 RepID=A0A516PZX7_9ACTN|nr:hypothetical protein [Microlunatus elymi]QDP96718.1 hypothetical protein FOE78_13090 [Microlunatus elymi]
MIGRRGPIRLIMVPVDDGFGSRHPSMKAFAGRFGAEPGAYGMPLGPNYPIARKLDAALRAAAAPGYPGLEASWITRS